MKIRSCPTSTLRTVCALAVVSAALLAPGLPALANDRPFESVRTAVAEDDDQVWSFEVWGRQIGRVRSLTVEPDYSFDPANSVQIELSRQISGSASGCLLHFNLSLQKMGPARRQWSSAVAFEQPPPQRSLLFAELARDGTARLGQVGVRHWLRREKLAIDLAWPGNSGAATVSAALAGWPASVGTTFDRCHESA